MKILGIETSCDETAAAVVEDGVRILSNVVVSQIDIFAEYGGVIPEVAARNHLEAMMPVINKALSDAGCTWDDIDAIAVTHAPGLLGSLLIGTLTARTLAILHDKPLYAVHHLKSHVYANWLSNAEETKPVFSSAGLEFSSTSYAGSRAEPSLRDEPVRPGRNIGVENLNQDFVLPKKQVSGAESTDVANQDTSDSASLHQNTGTTLSAGGSSISKDAVFNWDTFAEKVQAMNDAVYSQLMRTMHEFDGTTLHLYPERKIVKTILSRDNNKRILIDASGGVKINIHEYGEKPSNTKKDEMLSKISDIMGGEVQNDGGGNPF